MAGAAGQSLLDVVAVDRGGRAAIDWGVYGAPETFLVNPQGIVVYKHVGALDEATWTREILPRLPAAAGAGLMRAPGSGGSR